ncbi:conserved phage C-terminal domain-containing protein [Gordonibacter sp. Marseille-P4307]|uniref:conserved phage C-terminal domain-containing protein n=1 Tax=Gordonibacter sp. Marseille-P4307 TaxID=2161815 RepID=UPI000F530E9C|nr:conserved phage C-terminal domain-containing protein [Gordonibacter sp. Marseille-P4307]
MQLFDSHVEAGSAMARGDRERYYAALVEFVFYGAEPELEGAPAAVFTAIRPTLEESRRQRLNGKKGGRPKTKTEKNGKPKPQKTENPERGNAETQNAEIEKTKGNSKGNKKGIAEAIPKEGREDPPPLPGGDADDGPFTAFLGECLRAWADETGQELAWIPPAAARNLRRAFDGGVTARQVRLMVRAKRAEWGADERMARYVRASTLFGDKMADYLAATSKGAIDVDDPYAAYA